MFYCDNNLLFFFAQKCHKYTLELKNWDQKDILTKKYYFRARIDFIGLCDRVDPLLEVGQIGAGVLVFGVGGNFTEIDLKNKNIFDF